MKCPKCGFNSFEYYDSCKRCSKDLTGYKLTYSISSLVLPQEAKDILAADFRSNECSADEMQVPPETHNDIFSFDLPHEEPLSSTAPADDPFSFDDPAPAVQQTNFAKADDDIFADLLESTTQTRGSSRDEQVAAVAEPVEATSTEPGEFDLESFSWEDSPAIPATPGTAKAVDDADDFDSLFGDTKENNSQ
jgi:hypothetical protein